MPELSSEGRKIVDDLARRHGVGSDAVAALLHALELGNGAQAQFNHPDLGGMGQWSQGGMIMIGDMFNQGLKHRVDALCREIAALLRSQPMLNRPEASQSQSQGQGLGPAGVSLFIPGSGPSARNWWPEELGSPASTGAQNNLNYACFPVSRRLAIRQGGRVSVYDTGDHRINGFSQQQSGDQSLTFTSQHGLVRVADLPLVTAGTYDVHDPSGARFAGTQAAAKASRARCGANTRHGSSACFNRRPVENDRTALGPAPEEHSHRCGICGEKGGAVEPPVRAT